MRVTPYSINDIQNRRNDLSQFEIAIIAAKRTRELEKGSSPFIKVEDGTHEKTIAMMEIAAKKIGPEYLYK